MNKEIELYYSCDSYYGVSLCIWSCNKGNTREEFVNKFKEAIKQEKWLQQNMNIGETLDFIDTLSNNLNGDDLYKNVIDNFYYVEELHHKSYELGISDNFNKVVYKNRHAYDNSETISLFNKITPYLKNNDDFKEWFLYQLENEDKNLYLTLCNTEESKKQLIAYTKEQLKNEENSMNYYFKRYEEIKLKVEKLQQKLKDLEEENE